MTVLDARGVAKTYQKRIVALDGVSLKLEPGHIFGLLGPNGAGKTTLIKCFLDLVRPDRGTISLLGQPSRTPAARSQVGYLPEDHRLPPFLNARQLLDFVGRLFELPARERRARTGRLLEQVGLDKRANDKVKTYSKGMRQRLGIAQALMNAPQVLILDEPNEGLDPLGRADMKALLVDLKQQGVAVFVSSHVLTEVERICDQVAILKQGKLVYEGTVAALTAEANLEESFVALIRGEDAPAEEAA